MIINPEKVHKTFFESKIFTYVPISKKTIKNHMEDDSLKSLKSEEDRYIGGGGFFCNASGYSFFPIKTGFKMMKDKVDVLIDDHWGIHVEKCLAKNHVCNILKIQFLNKSINWDAKNKIDRSVQNPNLYSNIDWNEAFKSLNFNLRNLSIAPILVLSTELTTALLSIGAGLGLNSGKNTKQVDLGGNKIVEYIDDSNIRVTPMDILIYLILQNYFENFISAKGNIEKFMNENKYTFVPGKSLIGNDWMRNYSPDDVIKNNPTTLLPIYGANTKINEYNEDDEEEDKKENPDEKKDLETYEIEWGTKRGFFNADLTTRIISNINLAIRDNRNLYTSLTGSGTITDVMFALQHMGTSPTNFNSYTAQLMRDLVDYERPQNARRYSSREEFQNMIEELVREQPSLFDNFNTISFLNILFMITKRRERQVWIDNLFANIMDIIQLQRTPYIYRFEYHQLWYMALAFWANLRKKREDFLWIKGQWEKFLQDLDWRTKPKTENYEKYNIGLMINHVDTNLSNHDAEYYFSPNFFRDLNLSFGNVWRSMGNTTPGQRDRFYREIFWSGNVAIEPFFLDLPAPIISIPNPNSSYAIISARLVNWLWPRMRYSPPQQEEYKHEDVEPQAPPLEQENVPKIEEEKQIEPQPESLVEMNAGEQIANNLVNNPAIPPVVRDLLFHPNGNNAQDLVNIGNGLQEVFNALPPQQRNAFFLNPNASETLIENFIRTNVRYEGEGVAPVIRAQMLAANFSDLVSSLVNRIVRYIEFSSPNLFAGLNLFNYGLELVAAMGNNPELRKKLLKAFTSLLALLGFIVAGNLLIKLLESTGKSLETKLKDLFAKIKGEDPDTEVIVQDLRKDKTKDPVDTQIMENYSFLEDLNNLSKIV